MTSLWYLSKSLKKNFKDCSRSLSCFVSDFEHMSGEGIIVINVSQKYLIFPSLLMASLVEIIVNLMTSKTSLGRFLCIKIWFKLVNWQILHKKWSFALRIFFKLVWPKPPKTEDKITFTEKILNWKLHFLCSEGRSLGSKRLWWSFSGENS